VVLVTLVLGEVHKHLERTQREPYYPHSEPLPTPGEDTEGALLSTL
jgi:hypothetical protein